MNFFRCTRIFRVGVKVGFHLLSKIFEYLLGDYPHIVYRHHCSVFPNPRMKDLFCGFRFMSVGVQ